MPRIGARPEAGEANVPSTRAERGRIGTRVAVAWVGADRAVLRRRSGRAGRLKSPICSGQLSVSRQALPFLLKAVLLPCIDTRMQQMSLQYLHPQTQHVLQMFLQ